MVKNPNSVLQARDRRDRTSSSTDVPARHHQAQPGQGRRDRQHGVPAPRRNPPGGNAKAVEVDATFWIETVAAGGNPDKLQLQYTQLVQLDFNGLRWPHVTVATLQKQ